MKDPLDLFVVFIPKPVNTRTIPSVYNMFKPLAIFCFFHIQLPLQNLFNDKADNLKFNMKSKTCIIMIIVVISCFILHMTDLLKMDIYTNWWLAGTTVLFLPNASAVLFISHYRLQHFIIVLKKIDDYNYDLSKLPGCTFEKRSKHSGLCLLLIASLIHGLMYYSNFSYEFQNIGEITFLSLLSLIARVICSIYLYSFVILNTILYIVLCNELTNCFRQFNKSWYNYVLKIVNENNSSTDRMYLEDYRLLHLNMRIGIRILNDAFEFRLIYIFFFFFEHFLMTTFDMLYVIRFSYVRTQLSNLVNVVFMFLISSYSHTLLNKSQQIIMRIFRISTDKLNNTIRYQIDLLVHQLRISNVRIMPWRCFNVSRGLSISVFSQVISYIIVMIQLSSQIRKAIKELS